MSLDNFICYSKEIIKLTTSYNNITLFYETLSREIKFNAHTSLNFTPIHCQNPLDQILIIKSANYFGRPIFWQIKSIMIIGTRKRYELG